jgi:hypothetical protein
LGKNLHEKKTLADVNSYLLSVADCGGDPSVLFPPSEFCGKVKSYLTHFGQRAFSLLKMETYNSPCTQRMEQALHWTLLPDCLFSVDPFFTAKVTEIIASNSQKHIGNPIFSKST